MSNLDQQTLDDIRIVEKSFASYETIYAGTNAHDATVRLAQKVRELSTQLEKESNLSAMSDEALHELSYQVSNEIASRYKNE